MWGRWSVRSVRPPAGRSVLLLLASHLHAHIFMYVYAQTQFHVQTHTQTHVYSTHTATLLCDWFSGASDRSLWQIAGWQPNTKKAHTLTPNLWGGPGAEGGADIAAGLHSCLHHNTFFLSPPASLSPCTIHFFLSFFPQLASLTFYLLSSLPTSVSSSVSL